MQFETIYVEGTPFDVLTSGPESQILFTAKQLKNLEDREIISTCRWFQKHAMLINDKHQERERTACLVAQTTEESHVQAHGGYVYIIQGEDFFKIGCADSTEERINTFAPKLPFETEIVFTVKVKDKYGAENFLHTKFAGKRMNGEWFKLGEDDIAWIREWNGEGFKDE